MIPLAAAGSAGDQVLMVPNVLEIFEDMLEAGQGLLSVAEPVR
jgi:hypothetical protein